MASESEEYEYAYSSDDDDNHPGDGEDEEVSMDWSTAGAADNPNAAPTMLFRGGAGKEPTIVDCSGSGRTRGLEGLCGVACKHATRWKERNGGIRSLFLSVMHGSHVILIARLC